jgi:hypothetical protein
VAVQQQQQQEQQQQEEVPSGQAQSVDLLSQIKEDRVYVDDVPIEEVEAVIR